MKLETIFAKDRFQQRSEIRRDFDDTAGATLVQQTSSPDNLWNFGLHVVDLVRILSAVVPEGEDLM